MDSARPLFNSLKIFNVNEVYNYMVCNYIDKSFSRNENIFVHNKSQHTTRQAVNEVLRVPYTHSTQTMQSITYSGTRAYSTAPVSIIRFESFITFKYRLKAHILSINGGWFAIFFAVLLLFFFRIIEFQVWFMSIAKFSITNNQIIRLVLTLSGISFNLIIRFLFS